MQVPLYPRGNGHLFFTTALLGNLVALGWLLHQMLGALPGQVLATLHSTEGTYPHIEEDVKHKL